MNSLYFLCKYSTMVSALVCHTRDGSSILLTCSYWVCSSKVELVTVNHSVEVRFLPFPQIGSIFWIVEFRFWGCTNVINREDKEYKCTPPYLHGVSSSIGRAEGCGSSCCRFESCLTHKNLK